MNPPLKASSTRGLDIEEVRLVADLRIMHAKVEELHQVISNLKRRYTETAVRTYADQRQLAQDIDHVDDIYLWYVKLKEEREKRVAQ